MEEFDIKDGVLIKYNEIEGKTSVTIPNSVTKIGEYAFCKCKNLKSIILHEGITEIGNSAFKNCTNLETITFPESINKIENVSSDFVPQIEEHYSIFEGCTKLININATTYVFNKFGNRDKYIIVGNFVKRYNINNTYSKEDINKYKDFMMLTKRYVLSNISRVIESLLGFIDMNYLIKYIKEAFFPIIYFMCNNMDNAFTVKELEELIKISVKMRETETTGFLMDYKEKHFGHENPLDKWDLEADDNNLDESFGENLGNSKEEFIIKDGKLLQYNKDSGETIDIPMEKIDELIDFYIKSGDTKNATMLLNYKSSLYTDPEENMRKRK